MKTPTTPLRMLRLVVTAALLPLLVAACCTTGGGGGGGGGSAGGGRPADPDAKKRQELAELEREEQKLARLVEAIDRGDYAVVTLKPTDVENAVARALPLDISASELSQYVSGTITISKFKNVEIKRGKVEFDLDGKGKNIQVASAAGFVMSQKEINDYKAAVQSGMTVRVVGTLEADKGNLVFSGKATKVTLKKNQKLAGEVKKALNGSFFKKAHKIEVGALRLGNRSMATRAVVTRGDQLSLVFAE